MTLLQMRLRLSREDCCGAMIARTPEKLMSLSRMLQHLVFAGECLLALAFRALIFTLSAENSRKVSLEVALLSKRLLVRAVRICADQRRDMHILNVRLRR